MKSKRQTTKVSSTLMYLMAAESLLIDALRPPHEWLKRQNGWDDGASRSLFYYLIKKGLISVEARANKKIVKLTQKGELEALLAKSKLPRKEKWDGKWRLIIFDIPEAARKARNKLRALLKENSYIKLQASVFISPHPLNREAINYLKQTGLIEYIRILKVEEIDDDKDLRKHYKL